MTNIKVDNLRPIVWIKGKVSLIDQTRLPSEETWLELDNYRDIIEAIQTMRIRGAPAIGIAGAYAMALAAIEISDQTQRGREKLQKAASEIAEARPTGVNLSWAVERMLTAADQDMNPNWLVSEAIRIQDEDVKANHSIGEHGSNLIQPNSNVLTHCNAGALATGGYGTALGVIKSAWVAGKLNHVFATETRPLFQGARLTAWELERDKIRSTILPDSAVGQLIQQKRVQAVVVGADRIASNGDVANKVGTYTIAVLAHENKIPFYVAAPTSTIDMTLESGESIPIEERSPNEVTQIGDKRIAPPNMDAINFAFDVTPNKYITAIVTERGAISPPFYNHLEKIMGTSNG